MNTELPAKPFTWLTQDGERLKPQDMRTTHLFYAIRMIFNHSVPSELYRIEGGRYHGPQFWSAKRRAHAVHALWSELRTRDDIPDFAKAQLQQMNQIINELLNEHRIASRN